MGEDLHSTVTPYLKRGGKDLVVIRGYILCEELAWRVVGIRSQYAE
jgi:hypothetical protein